MNPFGLVNGGAPGWISFCKVCCRLGMSDDVEMCSFCLLTSIELFLYQTAAYCISILMI